MDCHADQGGVGGIEGRPVSLSFSGPRGWVLTWLRKGVEKVVPQPAHSSRPSQNIAAGLESPDQVLLGLGAAVGQGIRGGREVSAPVSFAHVCLSVCLSQQAGAQILGQCGIGGSGKDRRPDGIIVVALEAARTSLVAQW